MPRPPCCRRIAHEPAFAVFKPAGTPGRDLPSVTLGLDEFEALRLADLDGLYQEEIAARMGVSRPTVARILESARRKVAEAIVRGHVLRIEGGPFRLGGGPGCGHRRCEGRGRRGADRPGVAEAPGAARATESQEPETREENP